MLTMVVGQCFFYAFVLNLRKLFCDYRNQTKYYMDPVFTVILVVLAALAVSDLIVGVSNDATNFLNSAIGSKVAPRYVIMIVASVGIILGSLFSSGMMEVARSGVFFPSMFTFSDVMLLFLAVMLTDVILLDLFNTFGLPTSTTVSLVFELLGSAVAVAAMKIWTGDGTERLSNYINATNALGIISGILISVVVAFVFGSVIMYITRVIFSFRYHKTFRYIGALWCGLGLTAISYFAIFKGLKGTTIISAETMSAISDNIGAVVAVMIVAWTVIMAIVQHLFKVNILKITVLAGTFSLALAFAGNDLVNFIGVFMAGFDSYKIASVTGDVNMMMGDLTKPVHANVLILMIAGIVMTLTLWFSKKAQSVTETEVNLARQESGGSERFGSSLVSRSIVRAAVDFNKKLDRITPARVRNYISKRFEPIEGEYENGASFDLIRATVNLTVASLLISTATSFKLPLSTTYVTFMVAMGSSLADRAWGRESAVYRITGVLTVISGWFLTAFIAFTVAFIVATILVFGGKIAIAAMTLVCIFLLFQSNVIHKRRSKESETTADSDVLLDKDIINACGNEITQTMQKVMSVYDQTLTGIFTEDRRLLKNMVKESEALYEEAHKRKYAVYNTLSALSENYISTGHYYVQVVDYVNEVTKALVHITRPSFNHIDNNHTGFSEEQISDLKEIEDKVSIIYGMIIHMLKDNDYSKIDQTLHLRDSLFEEFAQVIKRQIARIKTGDTSTRTSMLYLDIISETKTMILQSRNLLKAQKHFVSK